MAKFKVGDKVRVVSVLPNAYHNGHKVGDVYNVEDTYSCGVIVKGTNRPDLRLLFKEIELVKEDVNMTQQYRTEKRKARVGERIIVTNAIRTFGDYDNGDVFTVKRYSTYDSGVMDEELVGDAPYIGHDEYEVIVDETPSLAARVTELEAVTGELSEQVSALKAQIGAKPIGETTKEAGDKFAAAFELIAKANTPNSRRADVIKRAREFIEDSKEDLSFERGRGYVLGKLGRICDVEFFVNSDKRTVVALLKWRHDGKVYAKAVAKCAPDDVFNADIGKAIALGRALGKGVSEFENAPKPTEFAVGQMTEGIHGNVSGKITRITEDKAYTGSSYWEHGALGRGNALIIDDTEAQY